MRPVADIPSQLREPIPRGAGDQVVLAPNGSFEPNEPRDGVGLER
jgi:hypothetical protein